MGGFPCDDDLSTEGIVRKVDLIRVAIIAAVPPQGDVTSRAKCRWHPNASKRSNAKSCAWTMLRQLTLECGLTDTMYAQMRKLASPGGGFADSHWL